MWGGREGGGAILTCKQLNVVARTGIIGDAKDPGKTVQTVADRHINGLAQDAIPLKKQGDQKGRKEGRREGGRHR